MNEALLKEFAIEVANAQAHNQWQLYLAMIVTALIVSFSSAYIGSYAKKRGENFATKKDMEELLAQLKQTTTVTEEVKAKVTHGDWIAREFKTLRRLKLEELLQSIHEAQDWLDKERCVKMFDSGSNIEAQPLPKIERIAGLYFPELHNFVHDYCQEFREANISILEWYQKILAVHSNLPAQNLIRQQFRDSWIISYKNQVSKVSIVEREARDLMMKIISS